VEASSLGAAMCAATGAGWFPRPVAARPSHVWADHPHLFTATAES